MVLAPALIKSIRSRRKIREKIFPGTAKISRFCSKARGGSNQGAGFSFGFNHQSRLRQSGNNPVALRKILFIRRRAGREFGNNGAAFTMIFLRQYSIGVRINIIISQARAKTAKVSPFEI